MSWVAHMPAGSAVPAATFEQTPAWAAMHDLQAVLQAVSQQTPCAQNVLRHSSPAEQDAPFSFFPHMFMLQELGDTHWLVAVHEVKQRVPLQMYGLHGSSRGDSHWPAALHSDGPL